MKTSSRTVIGALVGVGMLAGCAGAATTASAPLRALVALGVPAPPIPDSAKGHTLIYVGAAHNDVDVFDYPSGKLVQTLTGFVGLRGLCSDANGDVWITGATSGSSKAGYLVEYRHGGATPVTTLDDADVPEACAVDPSTGNLAAVNTNGAGSVALYAHARGSAKYYTGGSLYGFFSASYDSKGDLFFTGYLNQLKFGTGWLQKGTSILRSFRLDPHLFPHEGLAWDGQHLVVAYIPTSMYQYAIQGKIGKKVGSLSLGLRRMQHFAIDGSLLVATSSDASSGTVDFFHYSSGGGIRVISGVEDPNSVTISVAPSGAPTRE